MSAWCYCLAGKCTFVFEPLLRWLRSFGWPITIIQNSTTVTALLFTSASKISVVTLKCPLQVIQTAYPLSPRHLGNVVYSAVLYTTCTYTTSQTLLHSRPRHEKWHLKMSLKVFYNSHYTTTAMIDWFIKLPNASQWYVTFHRDWFNPMTSTSMDK